MWKPGIERAEPRSRSLLNCECGEKLANADFDTQATWTLGTGWSIVGGTAIKAAGIASDFEQPFAFVDGGLYRIEVVLSQVIAGSMRVRLAGTTFIDGVARSSNGTFIDTLTVAGHTALCITADATFAGRIERVSLRLRRLA